jgi:Ca2+-binding RTX toxin-like protein
MTYFSKTTGVKIGVGGRVGGMLAQLQGLERRTLFSAVAPGDGVSPDCVLAPSSVVSSAAASAAASAAVSSAATLGPEIYGRVDSSPVSIIRPDGQDINPAQPTWLIVHGWNSSPTASEMAALVAAVEATQPGDQVLTLDWSSLADTGDLDPFDALDAVPDVAKWAESTLATDGFNLSSLNLIGHSYGSYVCGEIASHAPSGVNVIDAIDPGYDVNSDIGGFDPEQSVNFSQDDRYSWAFFSPTGLADGGPSLDDATEVRTADQAFVFSGTTHIEGPAFYANLLLDPDIVGQDFSLDSLLAQAAGGPAPWVQNQFGHEGQFSSTGDFDAVIAAKSDYVTPESVQFVPVGSASPVTDTNASVGITGAGDLIVPGTAGNDVIDVQDISSAATVSVNGVLSAFGTTPISGVDVMAGAGDDLITIGPGVAPAEVWGGPGNDSVTAANDAPDSLLGGKGNDSLTGGPGNDLIGGGPGDDTLLGGRGADTLIAGAGNDLLYGGRGDDLLIAPAGADTLFGGLGENAAQTNPLDLVDQIASVLTS